MTALAPELAAAGSAIACFAASMARGPGVPRLTARVGVLGALVTLAAALLALTARAEPLAGVYVVDALSQFLKLGIASGVLVAALAATDSTSLRPSARGDLPTLIHLGALGMMLLSSAVELVTLYVALELSAYALYVLAALHRDQRMGSEGGARYLLFGAAASATTVFGITMLMGHTGTTQLTHLGTAPPPAALLGLALFLSGLLFKLAVFPFHAWAPDAYEAAPHPAATLIGTASKVAAIGILVRVLMAVGHSQLLVHLLLLASVASMTVGNLGALLQRNVKRLLGWSAIAHGGYALIGLVVASERGRAAALFYAVVYVVIGAGPFLVVTALGAGGRNPDRADLQGLARRSPLLAALLLVGMFGLAGIPPTPGFAGKWFLFVAAVERGAFWLVLVAAVNATISLYYYLQLIRDAWTGEVSPDAPPIVLTPSMRLAAVLVLAATALLGAFPGPVWDLAALAAGGSLPQ
ncbi:MAG: NADH-quinone oxidoreductase subunit N [Deltaproteobacteria bacterium]|nr:NADH-quinone oxidoreductase subunit N [Deltaproteobacteria bacterium]